MSQKKVKWTRIPNSEAHSITGSAVIPNTVYQYTGELPSSLQRIPGYTTSFTNYFITSSLSPEGIEILGKFALIREDEGVAKSYLYVFGKNEEGVYFTTGLLKDFDEHHFDPNDPIPIDKIFESLP